MNDSTIKLQQAVKNRKKIDKEINQILIDRDDWEATEREERNKAEAARLKILREDDEKQRIKNLPSNRAYFKRSIIEFKELIYNNPKIEVQTISLNLLNAWNFYIRNQADEFSFEKFCKAVFKAPDEE